MKRRSRALILALVILALCLALSIGATYALFSSTVSTNIHLQSGSLSLGFERVNYQAWELKDDGTLGTSKNNSNTPIDLVTNGKKTFEIENAVPGCWYQSDFKVTRQGDVAIDYYLSIIWDKTDANGNTLSATDIAEQEKFAKQIEITVSGGSLTEAKTFMLSEAETKGKNISLGSILVKTATTETENEVELNSSYFSVTAKFVNDEDYNKLNSNKIINNDAQSKSISFDVQIYATQKV